MTHFLQDMDGQLSFLKTEENDPDFILYIRPKIKVLQAELQMLEKFNNEQKQIVQKDFYTFLITFFKLYNSLSLEEILFIEENYSSLYHNLCKLFLEYLERFLFAIGLSENLEDSLTIQIEDFILKDQVKFRNVYYLTIIKKIKNRQKLRVNNYLVFRGSALVNHLTFLCDTTSMPQDLNQVVNYITKNEVFLKGDISFLEEKEKATLSILLLYYLEKNKVEQTLKEQMELFIVYHLSNIYWLNDFQKKMYENVKMDVCSYVKKYIVECIPKIKKHIKDFEVLSKFKKSGKYLLIEESECLDELPEIIDKEELIFELENFLNVVFMLDSGLSKEQLPIYSNEIAEERHQAMELALHYFHLFAYPENIENEHIHLLEDYIVNEPDFIVQNSYLCLTKSKMYARVGKRNIHDSIQKSRNLLQT